MTQAKKQTLNQSMEQAMKQPVRELDQHSKASSSWLRVHSTESQM